MQNTAAENAAIAREVQDMRAALLRLQALKVRPGPDARATLKVCLIVCSDHYLHHVKLVGCPVCRPAKCRISHVCAGMLAQQKQVHGMQLLTKRWVVPLGTCVAGGCLTAYRRAHFFLASIMHCSAATCMTGGYKEHRCHQLGPHHDDELGGSCSFAQQRTWAFALG